MSEKIELIKEDLIYSDYIRMKQQWSRIHNGKMLHIEKGFFCPCCALDLKLLEHGKKTSCLTCGLKMQRRGNILHCRKWGIKI